MQQVTTGILQTWTDSLLSAREPENKQDPTFFPDGLLLPRTPDRQEQCNLFTTRLGLPTDLEARSVSLVFIVQRRNSTITRRVCLSVSSKTKYPVWFC